MQSDARPGDAASQRHEARIIAREDVKVVPKPWGEERWLAHTDRYAGKLLILKKGHRLSLQYHERKHETQYVDSGRIKYTLGSVDRPGEYEEVIAPAGTTVTLPPGAIHRMEALEDSRFFEVSTPELTDVVRLEDDYGRAGTSA
ncbi:MAG: cupin [Chloroflexi bacterium]|nr:MAG: cupin [Chloroflexota bacterium]